MTLSYTKCGFIGLCSRKNPCFIGSGSYNKQPSFRGVSVGFVLKEGGGSCVSYPAHFQMLRPIPILLYQSLSLAPVISTKRTTMYNMHGLSYTPMT